MAQHTKADINELAKVLADVWADQRVKIELHNNSAEL